MSMKRAPARVSYTVQTYAAGNPTIYKQSVPKPVAVHSLIPDMVYEWPSSLFTIEINANEDFHLPLQLTRLNTDGSETVIDVSGVGLEFYIRPRFDHTVVIKKLTIGTGINVDDAAAGQITLHVAQATVATDLLVSKAPADHWDYFFNALDAGAVTELFRGHLVVHAGRYP